MKKLLLSSIVLFLFSASIMLFQISCQKQANARNTSDSNIDNKIFFSGRETSIVEPNLYSCNLDGTNVRKLTNETSESVWLGSW